MRQREFCRATCLLSSSKCPIILSRWSSRAMFLLYRAQSAAQSAMMREGARHLRPKRRAVVKLGKVAQLVDDDVVAQLLRQECDFVIKVEVAAGRAAAPARPGVADKYFAVGVAVHPVVVHQPRVHHRARRLAILGVMPFCPPPHHSNVLQNVRTFSARGVSLWRMLRPSLRLSRSPAMAIRRRWSEGFSYPIFSFFA